MKISTIMKVSAAILIVSLFLSSNVIQYFLYNYTHTTYILAVGDSMGDLPESIGLPQMHYCFITSNIKQLKRGDIIVYWSEKDETYITHRVSSVLGETIITKGDRKYYTDDLIERSVILGKVITIGRIPIYFDLMIVYLIGTMWILSFSIYLIYYVVKITIGDDASCCVKGDCCDREVVEHEKCGESEYFNP